MNKMWCYNFPKPCLCKKIIYLSWWINWKYLLAYGFSIMGSTIVSIVVTNWSLCINCKHLYHSSFYFFLCFYFSFPFFFFSLYCFFHHITNLINEPHRKIWVLMIISLKFRTKERDIIMTLHVEKQYIVGNGIALNSR